MLSYICETIPTRVSGGSISAPVLLIPVQSDTPFSIIDIFPEAIVLLSGTGALVGANPAARDLFGMNPTSGSKLSDLVSDPPEKLSRALDLWSGTRHFLPVSLSVRSAHSATVIRCDGAVIRPATADSPSLLLVRCVPRDEATATKLFVKLNRQIDSLWKQMTEQKSHDTERLNSLATAAAVFSHEVANPLNAISTSLQFLEMELRDREDIDVLIRNSIADAGAEIERLSSLVHDFRTFARPQFVALQPTDLAKTVGEVLDLQALSFRTAGVSVNFESQPLEPIMADSVKLKQAVLNLVKNAIEAMPYGGALSVKLYRDAGEKEVVLEIRDTGIGIPHDVDVFALFKTTKANGTGLGLPIVSQIVSAHHGKITYVSEPGEGTSFKIVLPAVYA